MRLPQSAMLAVIAASSAVSAFQAFAPRSTVPATSTTTSLNVFQLREGETRNMFDGPAPIVKERDACGVGFIANTQSGGEWTLLCNDLGWGYPQ